MATLTLTRMAEGGLYDQLGGGFCRYSVDAEWLVPHFEKMLYDNAQLAHLYLALGGISNPSGSAGHWDGTNPRPYGSSNPFHTWPACAASDCIGGGYYWLDEGAPYDLSQCQMKTGMLIRWNTDYWGSTGATGMICAAQTDYKFAWAVRNGDVLATPVNYTLTVAKSGSGTVTSNPAGISCGTDCSESYPAGTSVTLTAAAAPGYTFVGWANDCAGYGTQPTCTFRMDSPRNPSAAFTSSGGGSAYARNYVQKAYVAYYGRPADPSGLDYWAVRMDAEGGSLNAIIQAFGTSAEFNRRYGGMTNTQLVTKIYQQTLGRDPDPTGLA
jgi:uncharacterized repeat protein (TIGR02543 family)